MVGFSGTTDRLDLLPVGPNPRWRLGKFQMATSPERLVRSTSCLILGGVFWHADRMDLLPVVPNARFGRLPSWKISNDHISGQHILRNLCSCGRRCHLSQMVTVQRNPRKAHTSSPTGLFSSLMVQCNLFSCYRLQ